MTFLAPSDDNWDKLYPLSTMKLALALAIQTVLSIHAKLGVTDDPSSLNLCVSDGIKLVACRFRNSKEEREQPPSLYISTRAGATLNRKYPGHPDDVKGVHALTRQEVRPEGAGAGARGASEGRTGNKAKALTEEHGRHVIVASEPTTFDQNEWELVGKNEFVLVGEDMSVQREAVDVEF